ncbi:low molecular weight protein-tyrosine-phosphatase [Virgibacillus oceani]|uniref:protein-tyrosine-phosphatase n=1 Tax=Virgibacillus oceani TaxID=1479511 RepID=A0A917M4E4_9BACI|nr:low molecular weight protein-tyrosine-phosphatase [Virgibacillus oceani]GGG74792.1 low molecular weight protein-tyrosine-phosphatase YfkJ [Virgibacillus oceani]
MVRILFICLGNICRSPMAEAIFRDLVTKQDLTGKIAVDSAGIGHWHAGDQPHEGTREILDNKQISYEGMLARQVHKNDWDDFDYIIAMDDQNIKDLKNVNEFNEGPIIAKLMDFVANPQEVNVPDPYFTGDFEYTYELVSEGCKELLKSIRQQENL